MNYTGHIIEKDKVWYIQYEPKTITGYNGGRSFKKIFYKEIAISEDLEVNDLYLSKKVDFEIINGLAVILSI